MTDFKKNELRTAFLFIIIYVVLMSIADNVSASLGIEKAITAPLSVVLSVFYCIFIRKSSPNSFGASAFKGKLGKYLYFIPLAAIASVNLWNGVTMNFSAGETVLYIISMICAGFIEEVIFRGFLFTALCRRNVKTAIVISSLTFGIGHIVNLFNGAEVLETLLQICYASAAGFLFTIIFYKSGSLIPTIITHCVLNSLSAFAVEGSRTFSIAVSAALTVLCIAYSIWIIKKVPSSPEVLPQNNVISDSSSIN